MYIVQRMRTLQHSSCQFQVDVNILVSLCIREIRENSNPSRGLCLWYLELYAGRNVLVKGKVVDWVYITQLDWEYSLFLLRSSPILISA